MTFSAARRFSHPALRGRAGLGEVGADKGRQTDNYGTDRQVFNKLHVIIEREL